MRSQWWKVCYTTAFLGFFVALASTKLTPRSGMVVRSRKPGIPAGFAYQGPASAKKTIPLRIALVQNNISGLEKALYDVSDPQSVNYGKHLSKAEVEEYVKPAQASVDAVNAFLKSNSINATTLSPVHDWLGFSVSVGKANEMFDADFSVFQHVKTGQVSIRTLSYSIPSSLQGHIDVVHPTTNFIVENPHFPLLSYHLTKNGTATSGLKRADVPSGCNSIVTPACLQALYGLPTALGTQSSNGLAVAGFIGDYAQQADLTSFLTALRPDLNPNTTFALDTLDGGSNPQDPNQASLEANLDIQYTVGVAQGVPVTFISAGENNTDGWHGLFDMINFLLAMNNPPHVLTTSYGFDETGLDPASASSLCNAYMQLGARGTSIFFASGDGGVSGSYPQSCTDFIPTFPSTCPYVTSVGGTTGSAETAASFSSGGFSNIFSIPDYQASAISKYLSTIGSTNSGLFNTSGRGFPDVAAQAMNVEVYSGGQNLAAIGTSCASPIFASTVSLINDGLIAAGKSPLGFINPLIYANPGAFNDISHGDNPGCGTNGYSATDGWDAVTGLGSPNYTALRKAAGW